MDQLIDDICTRTGIDKATAEKVAVYLKENIGRLPALLQAGEAKGVKGALGNVASKVADVMRR